MKMPRQKIKSHFILSAGLFACLLCICIGDAQMTASAQNSAPPPPVLPSPPAWEQERDTDLETCNAEYYQQNIPRSQYHMFLNACFAEHGFGVTTTGQSGGQ